MIGSGLQVPNQPPKTTILNGLVSAEPLSALLARETATADAARAAAQAMANKPVITELVSMLHKHWQLAKEAKEPIERELLSAVRARRGEYDPDTLAKIRQQGGSEIYMMIFATKARQMKALLADILIGTGTEKPWTLAPTPKPTIPPFVANQITQAVYEEVLQAEMQGMPLSQMQVYQRMVDMKQQVENRINEFARIEAERAEQEIEDVMVEGNYLEALDQIIDDLSVFKTVFLKGPVVRMVNELQWEQGAEGNQQAKVQLVKKRQFERVDPFMMYPSPHSKTVHDGYLFERHKLSRQALTSMIGVDGYSEDSIRAVLADHGTGGLHEWLTIDSQKALAEGRNSLASDPSRSDMIDALQYWGSISGQMLREWGMTDQEVPDAAKEYEVELWLIGNYVIKAVLNPEPLQRRPYYTDGFSRIPGAFWHNSLFDVIRDCCDMCNSTARALANNLGIASGPQAVVNIDRTPANEEITEMFPWKVWQTTSDPMGSTALPVTFFQPSSNANELMGVFERFSSMADEYSGIPKYMAGMAGGEGGAGRTASGMSMMITNASKQIKNSVSSMDLHIIGQSVERTYQHLLMYEPDLGLTGDLQVRARGATSLLAKEAAQVRINEFLAATGNPVDMQIVGLEGRAELLRHAAKRLDIPSPDKVVPSETVVRQRAAVAQMQQMMAMQQQAQPNQGGQPSAGQQSPQHAPNGSGQELMDGAPVTDAFQPQ